MRTACFPTRYAFIVSKYGTPHTEVAYAHRASTFRAFEARGTHLSAPPAICCSKKIETTCVCMTNIVNVQNSG